jgi:hypothetical protein
MKTQELIEALQELIEENPKAANAYVCVEWEGDNGRGLERNLRRVDFRLTNGLLPEIVLRTTEGQ